MQVIHISLWQQYFSGRSMYAKYCIGCNPRPPHPWFSNTGPHMISPSCDILSTSVPPHQGWGWISTYKLTNIYTILLCTLKVNSLGGWEVDKILQEGDILCGPVLENQGGEGGCTTNAIFLHTCFCHLNTAVTDWCLSLAWYLVVRTNSISWLVFKC